MIAIVETAHTSKATEWNVYRDCEGEVDARYIGTFKTSIMLCRDPDIWEEAWVRFGFDPKTQYRVY